MTGIPENSISQQEQEHVEFAFCQKQAYNHLSDKSMDDKQQIETLYRQMYQAMMAKDTVTLNAIHADEFVLVHMTGMRQPKRVYIQAIADGTLNYYTVQYEHSDFACRHIHQTIK